MSGTGGDFDDYALDTGVTIGTYRTGASPCDAEPNPCLFFDPASLEEYSHQFDVTPDAPMMVLGFDIPAGDRIGVEMVAGAGGGEYFAEVLVGGQPRYSLTRETNTMLIGAVGRYRLRYHGQLGEAFVVCQPQSCCSAGLYVGT